MAVLKFLIFRKRSYVPFIFPD